MKKTKKITIALLALVALCVAMFAGCSCNPDEENGIIEWTKDNAVYATVKQEYVDEIALDVVRSFPSVDFENVLITAKAKGISLKLLFVMKNGATGQAEAIDILNADTRIEKAYAVDDMQFEPESTLALSSTSSTVKVGETLTITRTGDFIYYYYNKWSEYNEIDLTLTNADPDKEYTTADFPQVKLASVEQYEYIIDGRVSVSFLLLLEEPGYFNYYNAINTFAIDPNVVGVNLSLYKIDPYPASWRVSDAEIAEFVKIDSNELFVYEGEYLSMAVEVKRGEIHIKGLKPGKITLTFVPIPYSKFGSTYDVTLEIEVVV